MESVVNFKFYLRKPILSFYCCRPFRQGPEIQSKRSFQSINALFRMHSNVIRMVKEFQLLSIWFINYKTEMNSWISIAISRVRKCNHMIISINQCTVLEGHFLYMASHTFIQKLINENAITISEKHGCWNQPKFDFHVESTELFDIYLLIFWWLLPHFQSIVWTNKCH